MLPIGVESALGIGLALIAITLSYWALDAIHWEKILRLQPKAAQAVWLRLLVSIALGGGVAVFLIYYVRWALGLTLLFDS
ncbi:MAG: DUF1146 domain-containing protein [Hydrogenibacillus sp.]|nr:DUF1146 domain-containing protein [Hydrogenibacillus sp.]